MKRIQLLLILICGIGGTSLKTFAHDANEDSHNSLFTQNYTWTYIDQFSADVLQMAFGEPLIHTEKEYWTFAITRTGKIPQEFGRDDGMVIWNETSQIQDWPQWLIREEKGKVFGIIPEAYRTQEMFWNLSYGLEIEESEFNWEVPMYDFTCQVGDDMPIFDIIGVIFPLDIIRVEIEIIGGVERRVLYTGWNSLNPDLQTKIIENIGLTNMGCFPYLSLIRPESCVIAHSGLPLFQNGMYKLFNVIDEEGNIIYGKPFVSGVTYTNDDKPACSLVPSLDLFGREVTDPQPGTVYIRDGKKFVAK